MGSLNIALITKDPSIRNFTAFRDPSTNNRNTGIKISIIVQKNILFNTSKHGNILQYADAGYKKRISKSTQPQYFEDKYDNTLLVDSLQTMLKKYVCISILQEFKVVHSKRKKMFFHESLQDWRSFTVDAKSSSNLTISS